MAGSSEGSDPLAETDLAPHDPVVATATSSPPAAPAAIPATIGRYRIDGVLGQGAMGTVYAAHDPDLERRVALKVLRGGGSAAMRARLLREARAMARLSHPAVVTVHEVGTAGGVDYVAMELIDGTTVAQWIRTQPRPAADDVVDAFVTAGRGLSAAHAAGLIHRDFKPHNILRSRRGRIVVTDFGLARAQLDDAPADAAPGDAALAPTASGSTSLTSTLTATGAVLGTPAYMAPEQHAGALAGPAADQFGFCVALWEGLAGTRPFGGDTLAVLRAAIERGPDPATEARIPRRLRSILRRGLAPGPAARWPNMDALLAAIASRRRGVAVGAGIAAAAVVGIVAWRVVATPAAVVPGCEPAEAALARIRGGAERGTLTAAGVDGARALAALDRRADEWAAVQRGVCRATADAARADRITCLTAIRTELEVALAAAAGLPATVLAEVDATAIVADPSACTALIPPQRIVLAPDLDLIELARRELSDDAQAVSPPGPGAEPCRLVRWELTALDNPLGFMSGIDRELGDDCRDDYVQARIAVLRAVRGGLTLFGHNPELAPAERALARAGGDRYQRGYLRAHAAVFAVLQGDVDSMVDAGQAAIVELDAAGGTVAATEARGEVVEYLLMRDGPGDAARAEALVRELLALAGDHAAARHTATVQLADVLWKQGKLAEAHALAGTPPSHRGDGSRAITGRVVDAAGAPVAGAVVVAAQDLVSDPVAPDGELDADVATAVTDATGTFHLRDVEDDARIVADHGELRSSPALAADRIELVVGPTQTVTGRVERDPTAGGVELRIEPADGTAGWRMTAPIADDGSFAVGRVPYGRYRVIAMIPLLGRMVAAQATVVVGATAPPPLALSLIRAGDAVTVLVRNQVVGGISGGMAWIVPRTVTPIPKTLGDLGGAFAGLGKLTVSVKGDDTINAFVGPPRPDRPLPAEYQDGDVLTRIARVPRGPLTVCACAVTGDMLDPRFIRTIKDHMAELDVGCVQVQHTAPEQVVLVVAPPMKRFP